MKIAITGGNGYIGSGLRTQLSLNHDVISITRDDVDLIDSYQVKRYFSDKQFDVLIHASIAGGKRLHPDSYEVLDYNLKMYYNLLENQSHFNKFINIGSGAEVSFLDTPYGLSKHVIRQSVLEKDNFYNLRVFAVFDENELDTRFIKSNIIRYINKTPMIIHKNKLMDFFYMKDFVKLIEYYIENKAPEKETNCSYEDKYTLQDVAELINTLSTYKVDILFDSSDMDASYVGGSKLPITPTPFVDAIKQVYEKIICNL